MLGLGVEKLLEGVGQGSAPGVPGLSMTRREDSQHKQSPRKTHSYVHVCTSSQRYREAFRCSPTGLQIYPGPGQINRDSNPQGQLLPFPSRDTHTHLCKEREAHTSEMSTHTSPPSSVPECTKLTHVMTRVLAQAAPQLCPPGLALAPPL